MVGGADDRVVDNKEGVKEVGKEGGQEAREELEASSKHITETDDSVLRSGWKELSLFTRIDGPNPSLDKSKLQREV